MLLLYSVLLLLMSVYSYALVDLNLTLFNNPVWELFRRDIIQLGYFQRDVSSLLYIGLIGALFIFHYYFLRRYKRFNPLSVALIISAILLLSYPLLSHDFFNYMFDAKIVTFYGKNPYLFKALDFPADSWVRFMHWTLRTYPYGPTFLPLTLIPSFLGFGKLILNFLFFKLFFIAFYVAGVYMLNKKDRLWSMLFATSPLILIEGLVNAHNDFIALSLGIIGYMLLFYKRNFWGRVVLLISGGIKYITLPLVFLSKTDKRLNYLALGLIVIVIIYLSLMSEIQPWYFLALFAFIPIFPKLLLKLQLFFAGLLLSYYPFIRMGEWSQEALMIKHGIIGAFFILNVIYLFVRERKTFLRR